MLLMTSLLIHITYVQIPGPMAGRSNFQTATYQCIRPGELWQCNWLGSSFPFPSRHQKVLTIQQSRRRNRHNRQSRFGHFQ